MQERLFPAEPNMQMEIPTKSLGGDGDAGCATRNPGAVLETQEYAGVRGIERYDAVGVHENAEGRRQGHASAFPSATHAHLSEPTVSSPSREP